MSRYGLSESVVAGASGHPNLHNAVNGAVNDLDAITAAGAVYLDEKQFTGANDDARLTNAMSYAAAQTYPPFIVLGNRSHTFSTARTLYNGFRLRGPGGPANPEIGSADGAHNPCKVQINTSGTWLTSNASQLWNMAVMGGIGFRGTSSAQFLGGSAVFWSGLIRDVSFSDFKGVLGSYATAVKLNLFHVDGFVEFQNGYDTPIHIAGSDNHLFLGTTNIDSDPAYATAGGVTGHPHVWFDYLEKSFIGPIYVTCESQWQGLRVTGPGYNSGSDNQGGPNWIHGAIIEGRNKSQPCYGSVVRVEGGITSFTDCWFGFGMSSPASMSHSPTDAGMIHQTSGALSVQGCLYDRASGVAESVPFIYSAGGIARAYNTWHGSNGGTWSGLPRVTGAGVTADSSVTVV